MTNTPAQKRMLIATTVPADTDVYDVARGLNLGTDTTVWDWQDFWSDYSGGVTTPAHDATTVEDADYTVTTEHPTPVRPRGIQA